MKKIIALLLSFCLMFGCVNVFASTGVQTVEREYNNISVTLAGQRLPLEGNTEPFIINGTTFLPVRAIAEALGLQVVWNDATKTVELKKAYATPNDILVYEKDGLQNYYVNKTNAWSGINVNFKFIKNTGKDLVIQTEDASVNDIMFYSLFSEHILSGKTSLSSYDLYDSALEEKQITNIEKMELKFKVMESDTYDTIYTTEPIYIVW